MGFMIAQRAYIKLYLITIVEQHRGYGYEMLEAMKQNSNLTVAYHLRMSVIKSSCSHLCSVAK